MSPSMTLYYNAASPFARKVLILLHETGQMAQLTLKPVAVTPVNPDPELCHNNPCGKIPALRLADDSVIHDSRVILDYLDQQHPGNPLIPREGSARWRRLTLASLADALLDAAVLIRYETFLRPREKHWSEWLENQSEKIARSLAYFESEALTELNEHFDVASISLACALGYLDFRQPDLGWRSRCPRLASWYQAVSQRPSMLATQPTV